MAIQPRADFAWPIAVVGLLGGVPYGASAQAELVECDVLVGARRNLDAVGNPAAERVDFDGPLPDLLDVIASRAKTRHRVCILASGDPGFFGIVRALADRFGAQALTVHPAPSSVALAFARLGVPWDDADVVSTQIASLEEAVEVVVRSTKSAVLVTAATPPEVIGRALLDARCPGRHVAVCARIGEADEEVIHTDLDGLAAGAFDPLAVVVLMAESPVESKPPLAWGLADERFAHRAGMITPAEVRAVALGKLDLPSTGVLWDVGAGSGSVAVECARLSPGLRVIAVEQDEKDVARIKANAAAHRVTIEVVQGAAPDVLATLPDPDRAFVGGGGVSALDMVLARLQPGGTVVATYAALDRAAAAWGRLGNLVQLSVSRGAPIGRDGTARLVAENPVFVCWGPS
jgi:precorrin-6B C5,15-methyltransferase / cobalt-precorrin-6B C5,C15-methyltransferase